ncbi:PH domain-containing protein [Streptomyces albofaciens JCM 4342]|uniref:PH domain-containing protein n=1 Tax=Streptomyces albofaciens TaxID=66866 RepID=UPI001239251F|nr:PH domain-containing protein [Streptomyces albofaciens]KAA6214338.1 PH domain-containing protein [Streptomyces albofaciens JCM 4342]
MTSPEQSSPQQHADRSYRSPAALAGGVLLLALAAWLGGDALVRGAAHTKLLAVAGLLFAVPLVAAFTLRPLVRAGADRLVVRNPFRTVTLPWAAVEDLRASFSSEVFTTDGSKYQLWSIPVSLRQRKKANRQAARAAGRPDHHDPHLGPAPAAPPPRATADRALDELRELRERGAKRESAQGAPVVKWAYEVIAPCVVGAVALAVLIAL